MSSSDRGRRRPGRHAGRTMLLAAAAAVTLAACNVQPLYGPSPAGRAVATALDGMTIDPVDTRVGQEVRNKLLFTLNSGSEPMAPVYRVHLNVTSSETALGVTPVESAPAYSVAVTATYVVTSLASGEVVLRRTVRSSASYDRVNQVFANVRAKLDAENRAAALAADEIHIALAGAAAKGIL
jgi:LPS-assembly lipoprotein